MASWTNPRTWVSGELVTAVLMNIHLRDNLQYLYDRGGKVDYTPTWTSNGTQPLIGNGTLRGRYAQIGKMVTAEMIFVVGSTSSLGSGIWFFGMPVPPDSAYEGFGGAMMFNAGFANVAMGFWRTEGSVMNLGSGFVNPTDGRSWAAGSEIHASISYLAL